MYKCAYLLLLQKKDFIQLMIDAAETGEEESSAQNGGSIDEGRVAKKKIPLTIDEILGQVNERKGGELRTLAIIQIINVYEMVRIFSLG